MRPHLTTKLIYLITAVTVLAAAAASIGLGHMRATELFNRQRDALSTQARTAATHLLGDLKNLRGDVLFLSATPPIQGIIRARQSGGFDPVGRSSESDWRERLTQIFDALLQHRPEYFQVRYIGIADDGLELVRSDRRGKEVVAKPGAELQNNADRPYFGKTLRLQPGEVYVSPIELNQEHGQIEVPHRPTLRVATPVFTATGEAFGIVIINIDAGPLLQQTAELIQSPAQVYIVNEAGDYLYHPDPTRTFGFDLGHRYRVQDDIPALAEQFRADGDVNERTLLDELTHYLKVPLNPADPARHIAIVVRTDREAILAQEHAMRLHSAVLVALFAVALLIVSTLFIRRFTAPLRFLTKAAADIGSGHYQVQLPAEPGDEFGTLGNAFNGMVTAVAEREAALQQLASQLEQRVDERTAELSRSERELRVARERLQHLLAVSPAVVYTLAGETSRITFVSANIRRLLGYDPTTVVGTDTWWQEHVHADDYSAFAATFAVEQWEQSRVRQRYRIRHAAGHYLWVEDQRVQMPDPLGDGTEVIGSIVDISAAVTASEQLEKIAHNIAGAVFKLVMAKDGTIALPYVSAGVYDLFGVQPADLDGAIEPLFGKMAPQDVARLRQTLADSARQLTPWECEFQVNHPDGRRLWLQGNASPEAELDGSTVWYGYLTEVTARKQDELRLRLLANVFERSLEGILITDHELKIVQVNRAFSDITGYAPWEAIGNTPRMLSSGWHDEHHYRQMWQALRTTGQWQGEMWDRRKNGELYVEWLSITTVSGNEGAVANYIATFYDITEQKESEQTIRQLAYNDSLTELANRHLFQDRLEQMLHRNERHHTHFAVLYIDLDRFKPVNDSLGHKAGDILLTDVAQRLREAVRSSDTVARLGGDEFALLVDEVDEGGASNMALKIQTLLNAPFDVQGHEVFIGASIGICIYPNDGQTTETLMKHADIAMYRAKGEGGSRFQFFSPEMTSGATERLVLESALRYAVERNELELHYQPQVDLLSRRITGAEALVRWRHPERGLIPPDRFIPLAEETGLIDAIGQWVLREACRQYGSWRDELPAGFRIAVNLSPRQFNRQLVETIRGDIAACHGQPTWLELELTEGAVVRNPTDAIRVMNELAALGFQLAIDDFGTGYSSLGYLKRFPLDKLKIDRSFVKDIPNDSNDAAIATATIALAKGLGLRVIAEGVEDDAQVEFLLAHGCDEYQGYRCSPPLPAERFIALLRANHHGEPNA